MNTDPNAWLQLLKAGDPVIINGSTLDTLDTVARLTATQIVVGARGIRFRRKDGYEAGSHGWHPLLLREATPARVAELKEAATRREIMRQLDTIRWRTLPTDVLAAVLQVVQTAATLTTPGR